MSQQAEREPQQSKRIAVCAGFFDPVTNGHDQMFEWVSQRYERGIAAIGDNPQKKEGRFPIPVRWKILEEVTAPYGNFEVTAYRGMYLVDFVNMVRGDALVRGMRDSEDFDYERRLKHVNDSLNIGNASIDTDYFYPDASNIEISSSLVMGLVGFEGWEEEVVKMVPEPSFRRIKEREDRLEKERMWERFLGLCNRTGATGDIEGAFEDLYARYTESHRVYHGIQHIRMCFNELDLLHMAGVYAEDPDALEFALFYHDAVYEAAHPDLFMKADDEAKSAELAETEIVERLGLSQDFAIRVSRLVDTKQRVLTQADGDALLLSDIDRAILGRSSKLYTIYEKKIREEFGWVEYEVFTEKRIEILKRILEEGVYYTPFYQNRCGLKARENIERSIARLSQSTDS